MLYAFLGKDTGSVRQTAFTFAESLQTGDTETVTIASTEYQQGTITEFSQNSGLFCTAQIIVLDTPSENENSEAEFFENLAFMQDSKNHFILIEGAYDALKKKKIAKYTEKLEILDGSKKESFNVFALTDAFLRRDKKSLWLLLIQSWREGVTNEEIIGILFWQIKVLRMVSKAKTPQESGQKPFVYQKAQQALTKFSKQEVDNLSRSLLKIYHEGHLGRVNLSHALERWVLTI